MQQKRATMTPSLLLMPIALALASWASMARCENLLQLAPGFATAVRVTGADKGKFTAIVGDPTIADVTFGPQNTFMFVGKKEGITNVIVLKDSDGTEMYNARIEVGSAEVGLTKIHNKAMVTSYTVYKCAPDGCDYRNEVTASEPARLPIGYSSQNIQSSTNIQSNANVQSSAPSANIQSSTTQTSRP
jgi:Flp pilus assembly secretin CpaC